MTIHFAARPVSRAGTRDRLESIAAARERQLERLPPDGPDLVAAAHRSSVERILGQVRAAQQRLDDGTYGRCADCETAMPADWLEALPWIATCGWCSR